MYDAYKAHQETKNFEAYLLVQNHIQDECKNRIKETLLLQKLTKVFQAGGEGQDFMAVSQLAKSNFITVVYKLYLTEMLDRSSRKKQE